jgi:hypothetical protein
MAADTGTPDEPNPTSPPGGADPSASRSGPWAMPGVGRATDPDRPRPSWVGAGLDAEASAGRSTGGDGDDGDDDRAARRAAARVGDDDLPGQAPAPPAASPTPQPAAQVPPRLPIPPPVASPRGRPHWSVVAGGILVVVALLAGTVLSLRSGGGDRGGRAGDDATPAPVDSEPPTQGELEEVVAQISDLVEEERGLDFLEPVDVELEADDEFEARLFEDFEEDAAELERYEPLYKAFGLVEADGDLARDLREAYSVGVVGFYDSETKELVVRGAALTPFVRVTIAHELTHALDDQHFGLHRPEYDDADDEIGFGFTALVEGVATQVENAYLDGLPEAEQAQYDQELNDLAGGVIPDVSMALLELISAPYTEGPDFVAAVQDEGGADRLDEAYDDPPTTSEQVLVPEAFLEGEDRIDVPHPTPDGSLVEEGVLGQLFVQLVLRGNLPLADARAAAGGWGGDWSVSWLDGSRACARYVVVGDTADDTEELHDAWTDWAEANDGRGLSVDVEQPADDQPITLTSCTA